jgi:hypothetical protein
MRRLNLLSLVTGLLVSFAAAQSARAGMTVSIYNEADNVVATANGSIDLTSLTFVESGAQVDLISGMSAGLVSGELADFGIYEGISGPASWGSGDTFIATSGTGDIFGIVGVAGALALPADYVSGASLTSETVFSGNTIDTLGLTPGTYTYNWGSGSAADWMVVNISAAAPSSAPEPSTEFLGIIGIGAAIAFTRLRTGFAK